MCIPAGRAILYSMRIRTAPEAAPHGRRLPAMSASSEGRMARLQHRYSAAAVSFGLLLLAFARHSTADQPAPQAAAESVAFFEKEVWPLLEANCLSCHGGEAKIRGGLRLTSR